MQEHKHHPPAAEAEGEARTLEPPLWLGRLELPLEPAAVQVARDQARTILWRWAVEPDIVDDAELIVSELATNAVRHSRPPGTDRRFVLTLMRLPATLQIYLADDDPRPPVVRLPTDDAIGGRGLLLVRELSDRWGFRLPRPDQGTGKAVFAELRLVPPSPGEAVAAGDEAGLLSPIPDGSPFARARRHHRSRLHPATPERLAP